MATIKDVARHASVSIATVSRVINEPDKVRELTRKRVETAMQVLSFSRNALAASLVTRRTGCIGLIVPHLAGAFYTPLISTVEQTVRAAGSHLVISCGNSTQDEVLAALRFLKQRSCDAIIVTPGALDQDSLGTLLAAHPNVLVVHRLVPGYEHRCVVVDNHQGALLATEHLIAQGHQRIAAITGPRDNPESADRLRGMLNALIQTGLPVPTSYLYEGDFTQQSGLCGAAALMALPEPPTALFAFNDQMALGVVDYCKRHGVSVPDQLSVMGFDDVEFSDLVSPKLTTIHHPVEAIGKTVGLLALKLAKQQPALGESFVISPSLTLRESVGALN
ncbi:LacI family transcriptional regulator [Chitinivorax tropicus]|uniref:LacI family transcriptional regulator n=1 Tax=Chitinivorax tropicus TaxID=714531 RepID=A0A840MP42_9PROT|nr:LacI family DNA-binding transcriptional regulator [Chitinivorax tropicus]MBB5020210.1 LacI family transcriptional regulator [Chitinivorax tropicus]